MIEKEIIGKIQWLPDKVKEFPAGSGKFQISIKVNNDFYYLNDSKEKLEMTLPKLKVGYEIKIDVAGNTINSLEVVSDKIEETKSDKWSDDMISFEDLLKKGHEDGLKSVQSEVITCDFEKKHALVKVTVETTKGIFSAHGDATQENCQTAFIKPHFLKMAETRGLARALRFATNIAATAKEEAQ